MAEGRPHRVEGRKGVKIVVVGVDGARRRAQVAEAAARVEETLRIGPWRWRAWKVCVRMEGGHTAYRHHRLVITLLISPRIEDCLLRLFVVRWEQPAAWVRIDARV